MSDDFTILVEFVEGGVKQTSTMSSENETQSKQAIENALKAITWISEKARDTLHAAHHKPNEAEIEFGIKIGTKAGIIVAQADSEFHIKVKLVWKNPPENASNESG